MRHLPVTFRTPLILLTALALVGLWSGCRGSNVVTTSGTTSAQPQTASVVPAGTPLTLRLNETLGTAESRVGENFSANVTEAVYAETGNVAVPRGATVYGEVTGLKESERAGDQAAIRLNFDRIVVDGASHPFSASVRQAGANVDRDSPLDEAGIGAAAGAALGAILTGDLADTLLGGALGAGAGTLVSLGTSDADARLPAGTAMVVETEQRINLAMR